MLKSTKEHFKIGANLASCYAQKDAKAKELLLENFQAITPDKNFSVKRLYRESDSPTFDFTDWLINEFKDTHLEIHGHCLIHGSFAMSRWYSLSNLEIEAKIKKAIQSICDRYRGVIHEWEFLGEVLSPLGGLSNTWLKKAMGPGFPSQIFRWVREVDPDVPLFYTEYGLECSNKLDSCLQFCQALIEEGLDIAGVSVQYHHNSRIALRIHSLKEAFRQIKKINLRIKLGELTVWRDLTKLGSLAEAIQAHCYSSVAKLAEAEGCESLTFWSPFDRYAWRYPEKNPGLWDFDFVESKSLVDLKKAFKFYP